MKHSILALALALACGTAIAGSGDISKVNSGIHIGANEQAGDLDTVNGGITVGGGAQIGDAETVNGGIELNAGAHARSLETVNGGLHIGASATVAENAETVNGGIELAAGADVAGKLENVNGGIDIERAHVGGGIETVNGDIHVGANSVIDVGIKVSKPTGSFGWSWSKPRLPRIEIGPNVVVNGPLTFEREVELFVHESARVGKIEGAEATRFTTDRAPE